MSDPKGKRRLEVLRQGPPRTPSKSLGGVQPVGPSAGTGRSRSTRRNSSRTSSPTIPTSRAAPRGRPRDQRQCPRLGPPVTVPEDSDEGARRLVNPLVSVSLKVGTDPGEGAGFRSFARARNSSAQSEPGPRRRRPLPVPPERSGGRLPAHRQGAVGKGSEADRTVREHKMSDFPPRLVHVLPHPHGTLDTGRVSRIPPKTHSSFDKRPRLRWPLPAPLSTWEGNGTGSLTRRKVRGRPRPPNLILDSSSLSPPLPLDPPPVPSPRSALRGQTTPSGLLTSVAGEFGSRRRLAPPRPTPRWPGTPLTNRTLLPVDLCPTPAEEKTSARPVLLETLILFDPCFPLGLRWTFPKHEGRGPLPRLHADVGSPLVFLTPTPAPGRRPVPTPRRLGGWAREGWSTRANVSGRLSSETKQKM